jgi:purine-nucleoside/S-methyl-5'-thioadenosine phosphorylase / adenosine deaminase
VVAPPETVDALPRLPVGWRWDASQGVVLLRADAIDRLGIAHAFTTRLGGTSQPPFDSLNLGRAVGDDADAVRENRARALAAIGRMPDGHVEASQVHGADAAVVDQTDRGSKLPNVDILLTRNRDITLAIHCADCVPVLLADPVAGAIGSVHTGWRGTALGAVAAAVRMMGQAFGTRPGDVVAAVGPSIGPRRYEVDAPVVREFDACPWREAVLTPARADHWWLDLWGANRRQLEDAGVPASQVWVAEMCTYDHPGLFFSHRRDGLTGRMGSLISLSS